MNRLAVVALFGSLLFFQPAGALAGDADDLAPLLIRLAEEDARRLALHEKADFTVAIAIDTLRRGTPHKSSEHRVRFAHEKGKRTREILDAKEEGKDVTAREKGKPGDPLQTSMPIEKGNKTPFGAAVQPKYRFTSLGPDAADPTRLRIGFTPVQNDPDLLVGEAVVDPTAGALLKLSSHPSAYAKSIKGFKRLQVDSEYTPATGGDSALTGVTVDASYARLFVKTRFRSRANAFEYAIPVR